MHPFVCSRLTTYINVQHASFCLRTDWRQSYLRREHKHIYHAIHTYNTNIYTHYMPFFIRRIWKRDFKFWEVVFFLKKIFFFRPKFFSTTYYLNLYTYLLYYIYIYNLTIQYNINNNIKQLIKQNKIISCKHDIMGFGWTNKKMRAAGRSGRHLKPNL